jgi:hypothetical protein
MSSFGEMDEQANAVFIFLFFMWQGAGQSYGLSD